MRIGINVTPISQNGKLTGIGTYVYQVLNELLLDDNSNEFFLFSNGQIYVDLPQKKNIHIVNINSKSTFLTTRYLVISKIKKYKIDVYWSPSHTLPLFRRRQTKYYMTVYDVANYKFRDMAGYGKFVRTIFYHVIKHSCIVADKIFSISKATKNDIVELFKVDKDKIKVIYLGGRGNHMPIEYDYNIFKKHDINKPYFLYVGTLQTRKNINTIVESFIEVRKRGYKCNLVLAGGMGWGMEKTLELINQTSYKQDIVITGFISEREKWALYGNSESLVFPSLYEGFGIPILEAFEFGVPVITAYNSSLPEVGGEAAIYIKDALSHEELCEKMIQVLQLSADERQTLAESGFLQLQHFSWKKCAQETKEQLLQ